MGEASAAGRGSDRSPGEGGSVGGGSQGVIRRGNEVGRGWPLSSAGPSPPPTLPRSLLDREGPHWRGRSGRSGAAGAAGAGSRPQDSSRGTPGRREQGIPPALPPAAGRARPPPLPLQAGRSARGVRRERPASGVTGGGIRCGGGASGDVRALGPGFPLASPPLPPRRAGIRPPPSGCPLSQRGSAARARRGRGRGGGGGAARTWPKSTWSWPRAPEPARSAARAAARSSLASRRAIMVPRTKGYDALVELSVARKVKAPKPQDKRERASEPRKFRPERTW